MVIDNLATENLTGQLSKIYADLRRREKGELHVHLNGLISTDVLIEMIKTEQIETPKNFNLNEDLNHTKTCRSLKEYLKPWEMLRMIPNKRANLKVLVRNAFKNLKKDNIVFAELRNSLLYIAENNKVTPSEALGWLIHEVEGCSEEMQIKAGIILTVSRGCYAKHNLEKILYAYEDLGRPRSVIGLDIAGDEDIKIDQSIGKILKFAKERYNLGVTIHAGETGNIQNVLNAVTIFHADRIGHGTIAGTSSEVMAFLKENDICVEVCPISNRLTNAVRANLRHPVADFLNNDVPFVLCSDNPEIHQRPLSADYLTYFMETNDLTRLETMYASQKRYSFLFRS